MKPLFIFPVKECSTRLPRKNLLEINGKPLFMYPFEAMLKAASKYENSLSVLTTESEEIIRYASKSAILLEQNFIIDQRPEELAKDPYQMGDVCKYVMTKYDLNDFDPLVVIQCTIPFITDEDIVNCIKLYKLPASSVRVFRKVERQWSVWNDSVHGKIARVYPNYEEGNDNLQSLGGIVVCRAVFVKLKGSFPRAAVPYVLPKERAFDVDDETDFICAKALMEARNASVGARD